MMKNNSYSPKNSPTEEIDNVQDFFKKVDDYLIGDIEKMLCCGYIGFPCLQTIVSGMELIGILISGKKEENAFNAFWEELYKDFPQKYGEPEDYLSKIFREKIRNATAHYYLIKSGLYVHYCEPQNHLKITNDEKIFISCTALFRDFYVTYTRLKNSLIKNPQEENFKKLKDDINDENGHIKIKQYIKSQAVTEDILEHFSKDELYRIPPEILEKLVKINSNNNRNQDISA